MKKIFNFLIIPILIIISYEVLSNSQEILNSVNLSLNIWKNNIFPSLFPFFIISSLLINYGAVILLSNLFKPLMNLFKINSNASFVVVMGLLSGFPSSAIYTKRLYEDGIINEYEASKVLTFTHFSNPLFLLTSLSITFLHNKKAGLLILLVHYISNFFIGLIFRNYHSSPVNKDKFNFKKMINDINTKINNSDSFGSILTLSINNAISTLLTILGTITVFLVFTTIINNNIHLDNLSGGIINGLFEMTQGLNYISLLSIPLRLKSSIFAFLISFGGFSIHMQIISIISDTKIKYYPFLIARILHGAISSLLVFILFNIWIII